MRLGLISGVLSLCLALIMPSGQVQANTIRLGGGFGVGHLPMTDWRNFGTWESSKYEADPVALYGEVYGRLQVRDRHGVSLSVERISNSASDGSFDFSVEWDFVAIPINLTYEFAFRGWTKGTTPFFGLGMGLYRSQVKSASWSTYFPPAHGERHGWGYGLHGYIGQSVAVTQSLAASVKLRGRWADGMYFTDGSHDVDVDFTGIDVTVGMEWLF